MDIAADTSILESEDISRDDVRLLRNKVYASADEKKNLEEEVEKLSQTVKSNRDPAKTKMLCQGLGIGLWLLGRAKEAVEVLGEVKSRRVPAYYLGKCYEELGEYEKALDSLEMSRKDGAREFDLEMDLIGVKRKAGMLKEALKRVTQLSKAHGDEAELHYQWGCCLEDEGEYVDAMSHYQKALELDPEHAGAHFRIAYNYDLEGEDDKAIEYYEKCEGLTPTFTSVFINLGTLYEDRGEYEKAITCFETVLRADPDNEKAYLYLKDAKASLNMYYDEERIKARDRACEVLNIPISDFELSVRSKNCLERMNIRTLRDLTLVTETDLLSYKNFGETSLNEIKDVLVQKGLSLGRALEAPRSFLEASRRSEEQAAVLESPLAMLELSARTTKALEKLEVKTVAELVSMSEEELSSHKTFKSDYLAEIKEKLLAYELSLKKEGEEEKEESSED
ncbi:MAG: tetratricopeptide repeat protein [Candidatus Brocadiales bacterium]|nr:tetratricopeptide repeat protein [Candidatus Bathyanammoxibius sp.]